MDGTDTAFNDSFDIDYVKEKHPKMRDSQEDWLPTRLGRLISKRRQFIKYSRHHKVRLELDDGDHLPPSALAPRTENEAEVEEEDADEVMSAMSNASSVLKLPALADLSADGDTFECPICFTLQTFQREKAWRVHAFCDLRAYVCTTRDSEQCDGEYFGDRDTWFEHELHQHRAQYTCTLCQNQQPLSSNAFKSHIAERHPQLDHHQLQAVEHVSRQTPIHFDANDCPFCNDWAEQIQQRADPRWKSSSNTITMVSATRFRRHVALHQEQLAIFSVPRAVEDGDQAAASHTVKPTEKTLGEDKSDPGQVPDDGDGPQRGGMTDAPAVTDPAPINADNWFPLVPTTEQKKGEASDLPRRRNRPRRTIIVAEPSPNAAIRRAQSMVAAQKYRERKAQSKREKEDKIQVLQADRDFWRRKALQANPLLTPYEPIVRSYTRTADDLERTSPPPLVEDSSDSSDTAAFKRSQHRRAVRGSRARDSYRMRMLQQQVEDLTAEQEFWERQCKVGYRTISNRCKL